MHRIALYSQDTHGLGRMRRNIAIARALADDEPRAILLVSGAGEAAILGLPEGADTLGLPALEDAGHPGSRCLGIEKAALIRLRAEALRAALTAFRPDALVVDRLPVGVGGELRASFDVLDRMGTRLVLGLPDVLGDHARVWADWHVSDSIDVVRRHYDRVWVYGDPHVFDPVVEHGLPRDVRRITRYTGYLDGSRADPGAAARTRAIRAEHRLGDTVCVCLTGGSADGARLATAFARTPLPRGTTGVVLTGPFMDGERHGALEAAAARRDDLRVIRVLPGADTLIGMAEQVVAMGGYHTTAEALAADRRALIVPSAHDRPDQRIRGERLRELGAVDLLPMPALTPAAALGAWIANGPGTPSRLTGVIDTDGLGRLPMLLDELGAPVPEAAARHRTGARRLPSRRAAATAELAATATA